MALDPRTKILIWLLANVVVFAWTPEVFRMGVMLAYFVLFLLERKGKMLAGLLLALSLIHIFFATRSMNTGPIRMASMKWVANHT